MVRILREGTAFQLALALSIISLGITVIICAILLPIGRVAEARGLFWGTVTGSSNLILLARTLNKAIFFGHGAFLYTFANYIARFLIMALFLFVSLQRKDVNLITALLGLLLPRVIIITGNLGKLWSRKPGWEGH